jgi:serine kinase of HPr protein (carbohydrate metabolism regulator)
VPPLGVLSVVAHFGQRALLPAARITMLLRLGEEPSMTADPLEGGWFETRLAGISLPTLRLRANSCEDLATLTEAAAREGRERRHGRFAGRAFTTAQRQLMDRQEPCD